MKKLFNFICNSIVVLATFFATGFLLAENTDLKNEEHIMATVAFTIIVIFFYKKIIYPITSSLGVKK